MATYIFSFLKHSLFVRTSEKSDVKLYRRTNAPISRSFTAKTSENFPFTWSAEAIKSPKLQMKVLFWAVKVTLSFLLELFNMNDFESDDSEEKNYKIELLANEINLHK